MAQRVDEWRKFEASNCQQKQWMLMLLRAVGIRYVRHCVEHCRREVAAELPACHSSKKSLGSEFDFTLQL